MSLALRTTCETLPVRMSDMKPLCVHRQHYPVDLSNFGQNLMCVLCMRVLMCVYVCVCVHVCMCVWCVSVCTCDTQAQRRGSRLLIHTHAHTHTCTLAHTHTHVHARTHAYTYTYTRAHIHKYTRARTHTQTHTHTYTTTHTRTHTHTFSLPPSLFLSLCLIRTHTHTSRRQKGAQDRRPSRRPQRERYSFSKVSFQPVVPYKKTTELTIQFFFARLVCKKRKAVMSETLKSQLCIHFIWYICGCADLQECVSLSLRPTRRARRPEKKF